jgi:hypothetical protein
VPSATFDTNIYVSALIYGGTPLRLLNLAIAGDLEAAISQPILDETLRTPYTAREIRVAAGAFRERRGSHKPIRAACFSVAKAERNQGGRTGQPHPGMRG